MFMDLCLVFSIIQEVIHGKLGGFLTFMTNFFIGFPHCTTYRQPAAFPAPHFVLYRHSTPHASGGGQIAALADADTGRVSLPARRTSALVFDLPEPDAAGGRPDQQKNGVTFVTPSASA